MSRKKPTAGQRKQAQRKRKRLSRRTRSAVVAAMKMYQP